jgi:hypothetical protein
MNTLNLDLAQHEITRRLRAADAQRRSRLARTRRTAPTASRVAASLTRRWSGR